MKLGKEKAQKFIENPELAYEPQAYPITVAELKGETIRGILYTFIGSLSDIFASLIEGGEELRID